MRGDNGKPAPPPEPWGGRTEYRLLDDDHLIITAYNIMPGGPELKTVELAYERMG